MDAEENHRKTTRSGRGRGQKTRGRGVRKGPECLAANPKQGKGDDAMGVGALPITVIYDGYFFGR